MKAWTFALRAYADESVRAAALELQDRHGHCISLLLWSLWAAAEGRAVDDELRERAVTAARRLEFDVLRPSRRARAFLRTAIPPFDDSRRDAARRAIGASEIAVERLLIETLEAMTPPRRGAPRAPAAALRDLARAWGRPAPSRLVVRLSAGVSRR